MAVPALRTPPTNNLLSLAPPLILASRFGWQPLRLAFVEQQQDCEQCETPACIEMRDAILDCLSISDKNAFNSLVGGCLSISYWSMGGGCADGGGGVLQWVGIDSLLLHSQWEGVVLMVVEACCSGWA